MSAEYHLFDTDMRFSADTSSKKNLMEKKQRLTGKKLSEKIIAEPKKNLSGKMPKNTRNSEHSSLEMESILKFFFV